MPGRIEFDVNLGPARDRAVRPDASDRLRILVLGNLAGRRDASQRPPQSLADRAIHAVDLDNFDQVLARIAPSLVIEQQAQGGPELAVSFDELEAFHPDALYDRLDLFRRHRDLKARLKDPARFEAAAREMIESGSAVPTGDASIPDAASESVTELSERLLGGKPRTAIAPRRGLDEVIRRLVEPYVQQDPAAGSAAYLSALDAAASLIMRDLLRHPAFREIESNWRSVRLLVEELDVDHSIDLTLFDASRQELAADTAQRGESPESTQLYRKIVDGMDRNPPALIVAAYEFGATPEDLHLLAHLGRIGASIGAPVIGAAAPALFGAGSLAQHPDPRDWATISGDVADLWQALRSSPIAPWIGLIAPRFLLRQPYGASSDAIDAFAFEEITDPADHDAYLWSNPAFAGALLIGLAFQENGWEMAPGDVLDIGGLPTCVVEVGGERTLKPCAEVLLSERAANTLLARGVMPLLSHRERNECRLARFQSIADPAQGLAGPWAV